MIQNGAYLWETLCQEAVGCDSTGDPVTRVTTFGTVAQSHGLVLSAYQIGRTQPSTSLHGEWETSRKAVVSMLRGWADAIEAGK